MRNFAYKNDNFEKDTYVPELVEGNPCYQASVACYEKFCL
nr:MAG TPA: hypothetical protein [Microviridae sp.]